MKRIIIFLVMFSTFLVMPLYVKAQSEHHGQTEEKIAINQGSQTFLTGFIYS